MSNFDDGIENEAHQKVSPFDNVVELNRARVFSRGDVDGLLPLVKKITQEYYERIQSLMSRLEAFRNRNDSISERTATNLEKEINDNVRSWQTKLEKLGARTKGLWIADFDSGDGFFCWKYPEERIGFWHQYNDGFRGRVALDERGVPSGAEDATSAHLPEL